MRISDLSSDVCASDLLVLRGQFERGLEIGGADDLQHRAENLFLIAFHVGGDMVEQGRADEEAVLMPLEREAATVDDEFGALVGACLNPGFDLCLVRGGDDGAVNRIGMSRPPSSEARRVGKEWVIQCRSRWSP